MSLLTVVRTLRTRLIDALEPQPVVIKAVEVREPGRNRVKRLKARQRAQSLMAVPIAVRTIKTIDEQSGVVRLAKIVR